MIQGIISLYLLIESIKIDFYNQKGVSLRLKLKDREVIRDKTRKIFGSTARVLLFGSRADDTKKGGDIDLLVEADNLTDSVKKKLMLVTELQFELGERKIDIVTVLKENKTDIPLVIKIARETGIEL